MSKVLPIVWTDKQGVEHRLTDMDDRYLLNVKCFLLKQLERAELNMEMIAISVFASTGDEAEDAMECEDRRAYDEFSRVREAAVGYIEAIDSIILHRRQKDERKHR